MERYVFPRVGSRPVSEVNTADVLEILSPIELWGRLTRAWGSKWRPAAFVGSTPHREAV